MAADPALDNVISLFPSYDGLGTAHHPASKAVSEIELLTQALRENTRVQLETAAIQRSLLTAIEASATAEDNARLRSRLVVVERELQERVKAEARDPEQTYFWTSEWQDGEREADEDIAAGRVQRFLDIADALTWLEAADDEEEEDDA